MKVKRILLIALLVIIVIAIVVIAVFNQKNSKFKDNGKLNIVTTTFSTYDFIRQIAGDKVNLVFLLGPGVESHGYEPTAADLIKIQNSDIFVYVGGEMENWTEKVLESLDIRNTQLVCIANSVDTIKEQEIEGAEEEHEESEEEGFDEHIWTSPKNAMQMVETLKNIIIKKDSKNQETYKQNASKYINEIKNVQSKIQEIVDNKVRDRLVFGDKMPMQYFMNEFNLKVSAAFMGCSTETEPSSSTIAYLINKIKEEKIPVVLYIELNTGKVAETIAKETSTKAMQIQSLHNVSKDDFQNGETYVSLMTRNLEVLKAALQ